MTKVKAVCHVHSDWSYDGTWPLEKLVKVFGRLGIGAILTTEHERGFDETRWANYRNACREASNDKVKVVPGLEYSDKTNTVHILTWGAVPFLGVEQETGELLKGVSKFGGVAVLAHPDCREAWEKFELSWAKHLRYIEVWNRKFDGFSPSQKGLELLSAYNQISPLVGMDFHCGKQLFPLSMIVKLNGTINEQAVFKSFFEGRVCPSVWGLPLSCFTGRTGIKATKWIECSRRNLLRVIREIKRDVKIV